MNAAQMKAATAAMKAEIEKLERAKLPAAKQESMTAEDLGSAVGFKVAKAASDTADMVSGFMTAFDYVWTARKLRAETK